MKKEQKPLEVIVHGEIDLKKMPKDLFDAFIAALEDDMCKWLEEERLRKEEAGQPKINAKE